VRYQQPDEEMLRWVVDYENLKQAILLGAASLANWAVYKIIQVPGAKAPPPGNPMRRFQLPLLGSNQDPPDPESGVLLVTPRGSFFWAHSPMAEAGAPSGAKR
jgi:hypothetical protein